MTECPGAEFVGMASFQVQIEKWKLIIVIWRCCFAGNCKDMHQNVKGMCRAIVFAHWTYCLRRSRCRCCIKWLLKLPNINQRQPYVWKIIHVRTMNSLHYLGNDACLALLCSVRYTTDHVIPLLRNRSTGVRAWASRQMRTKLLWISAHVTVAAATAVLLCHLDVVRFTWRY